ncbi:uncharacterized protein A4U43_C10F19280 [Asparagus officinalis]|uniref:Uncharacterized protein n=1 Tax=Asparagus officinalis TaxID=4686 RepID=A0A5P1E4G4_ASPOF|nr:uncharacterized protein A4U43_C10F19280 [Asparagus officinalis]
MALMFVVLCGFSFYLGGIFCSEKNRFSTKVAVPTAQSRKDTALSPLQVKPIAFPECGIDYQDYTPCTDPKFPALEKPINEDIRPPQKVRIALLPNTNNSVVQPQCLQLGDPRLGLLDDRVIETPTEPSISSDDNERDLLHGPHLRRGTSMSSVCICSLLL